MQPETQRRQRYQLLVGFHWEGIRGTAQAEAFSTQWDTAGQKTIVFEACNNDGCDSGEHNVVVDARPLNPPTVNSLGCSANRVDVGETVTAARPTHRRG